MQHNERTSPLYDTLTRYTKVVPKKIVTGRAWRDLEEADSRLKRDMLESSSDTNGLKCHDSSMGKTTLGSLNHVYMEDDEE